MNVNGELTLGENTADNGGVRVALMALLNTIGDGARRLTASLPSSGCSYRSAKSGAKTRAKKPRGYRCRPTLTPRPKFRVNGVVQNMPEFQKAFSCKAGQPMVSANACRVW